MNNIDKKIRALPELYQPVYGHPELSASSSRSCVERLTDITNIYRAVEASLGRPLKVLDLGCAQGFFSLNLAALGASVHGVDFEPANIDLCNELSALNPGLSCSFELGDVVEVINRIEPEEFDFVLGLSVFHHVVHFNSLQHVQEHLGVLLSKVSAFVAELAVREEPLYWADSLPEDPSDLLKEGSFVHQIAMHSTHLADIPRPLYFASNSHWYLDGVAEPFEHWTTEPHALAEGTHKGARRYYFSQDKVVKLFRLVGANYLRHDAEISREADFLKSPPPDFPAPRLFLHGRNHSEIWLVSERLPGRGLLEVLREAHAVDIDTIIHTILDQLVVLENGGLYHDDLRIWNVLVDDESHARIIDFGSIQGAKVDCVPPRNIFLSFILFIKDLVRRNVHQAAVLREVIASPYGIDSPYFEWLVKFWNIDPSRWSFSLLRDLFDDEKTVVTQEQMHGASVLWQQSVEDAVQDLRIKQVTFDNHAADRALDQKIEAVVQAVLAAQAKMVAKPVDSDSGEVSLEAKNSELLKALEESNNLASQLQQQLDESLSNAHHWFLRAQSSEYGYNNLIKSTSWRMTAPLRFTVRLIRGERGRNQARLLVKQALLHGVAFARSRPWLKRSLLMCLSAFPSLRDRVATVVRNNAHPAFSNESGSLGVDVVLSTSTPLTKRGQAIYNAFMRKNENKENF